MTVSRSLIQEVEAAAQRYPGKVAVKFKGAELNYKELWAKVSCISIQLSIAKLSYIISVFDWLFQIRARIPIAITRLL